MSQDYMQFVDDAVARGMAAPEVAQALGQQYPQLSLAEGALAIRRLAAMSQPAAMQAAPVAAFAEGMQALAVAFPAAAFTANPVEDAAYEASLLRLAFPGAQPAEIGEQVRAGFPALTAVQMAQVLIHGAPYSVFPGLQPAEMAAALADPRTGGGDAAAVAAALHTVYPTLAAVDVGTLLMAPGPFPGIDANGMAAALTAAGFDPAYVAAAVAQLFPAPPVPAARPLLVTFDGSNQVQVPTLDAYNFGPGQDFTLEAWIRAPQQTNLHSWDNNIIEKWGDDGDAPGRSGYPFCLRIGNQNGGSAGHLFAGRYDLSNNPAIQSAGTFMDDQFHHVALTNAGRQLTLYVDGLVQGTAADTTSGATGNGWPLYFGVRGGAMWPDNFTGRILEVRLWNLARSQQQIAETMRRTVDPGAAGLVGYFKLRDGAGTVAADSTAAANNGVVTIPQWTAVDGYPLVETTVLPPVGGPGAPFDDTAAALATGMPLSRIRISSGNIVDSIQAFYGTDAVPLPGHGGGGGGPTDIVLDPADPIVGMKGFWGQWFGGTYVLMLVFKTRSGKIFGPYGDMAFAGNRNPFVFDAPPGQSLLAFSGTVAMGNNGQSQFLGSFGVTMAAVYP
jgi:Concanavalin A-like lectin/glucanases superfamily